jgi:hypothetical protein
MPLEPTVSRDLANVINGVGSPQELLSVANIRVLFFGDDIQSPSYGYRSLVLLSSVRVEKSVPPATDMQLDQELLAVDPGNNSITENFLRLWAPFRVKAETHFIVIFTDLSTLTPNLSRHGSPFTHIRSTSTPRSRHSPIGFQAPSPIGALTSLHGLSDASFETSRTGSPTIGMAINRQLSDSPSAHQFPSTPFSQDSAGDHLVPGTSVETVCRSHGITDEALRAAEYKPAEKTFLGKVLNHRRMLEVLVKLRLQERYGIIFTPSRSVTYVGGLQLAAVDVLMAYGWSIDSYKHKTVWFGWAEEVSSRQWVKPIPSKCLSVLSCATCLFQTCPLSAQGTELQRYQCWQGIRYIWAAGGPLDLGFFPNNASASPEGQLALKFKQKHIETYRSSINDRLDTLQAAQQAT